VKNEHREQDVARSCGVLMEAIDAVLDDAEAHLDEIERGHKVDGSLHCPLPPNFPPIFLGRAENP
jgi:hypothetical protein